MFGQEHRGATTRRIITDGSVLSSGRYTPPSTKLPKVIVNGLTPDHRPAGLRRQHGSADGFALTWARRYRTKLRVTDTVLIAAAVVVCSEIVGRDPSLTMERLIAVNAGIALLWLGSLWLGRTRDPRVVGVGPAEYKKVVGSSAAAFGWLAVAFLFLDARHMNHVFLLTMPVGTASLLVGRWSWRRWLTHQRAYGHYLSRVIVLGAPEDVAYVVDQIGKKSGAVYEVVGVALDGVETENPVHLGKTKIPVIGRIEDVCTAVKDLSADAVVVAGPVARGKGFLTELGWQLEESATELVVALSLTNVAGPRIQMRPVEGLPLMHVELPHFSGYKHLLKRSMDVAASFIALAVLLPVFAVLALLIRWDSAGPVIFRQQRVGRDGTVFEMYKFRSMCVNAEDELKRLSHLDQGNGVLFKIRDDPRITKVGAWMRRYSLDELPQFLNVLKGQMSLVGPRPPLADEVAKYDGHAYRRLYIKPGVTGLWQVSGRSDLSWQESVRLDLYYVENWSITGDLMIMWRTLKVMLAPDGAY